MIVKSEAIVLRARKLRETSRFLTLYTAGFGKLDVVAKGVRQQKSKLRGVLEPFSEISAVLYRKENRGVQYLSDAELLRPRRTLSSDYEKISAAFAVVELTDAAMHHEEANPAMYVLLRDTLQAIDDSLISIGEIVLSFQISLIHVLGFGIQFDPCIQCGENISENRDRWFSPADGGFRCAGCGKGTTVGTKVSVNAYTELVSLRNGRSLANPLPSGTSLRAQTELRGLLNAYILHHTESKTILRAGAMFAGCARSV